MNKRVFLIVLDSFGIGAMDDAELFGDIGANTLRSISKSNKFHIPTLTKLGLCNIDGVNYLPATSNSIGAYGRLSELSKGKDTIIGHWEIAGIVSDKPMPTYPNGFPAVIIDEFKRLTGRGVLCNKTYSGTEVIKEYGEEHLKTGELIVYTSADSVFQIAAHEDIVSVEKLYEYCNIARRILTGEHSVARVIARPFTTENSTFVRTSGRHDFSLEPPKKTMLDFISGVGLDTIAVGKIHDIFSGCGITKHIFTKNNSDGMKCTEQYLTKDFNGLCFVNLVDFDMLFGHRNDIDGYADAISDFDTWLSENICKLKDEDVLIITADHGCDPGYIKSTDHSREYVPVLIYGKNINNVNLGTRHGFCDIGKTICDYLNVKNDIEGHSFLEDIYDEK